MYSNQDIADYYDQTEEHFQQFWKLSQARALHYGIWYPETRTFVESLNNTNKLVAEWGEVNKKSYVLDAGCGIGGSSLFLAQHHGCKVRGVSLSRKQVSKATKMVRAEKLDELATFQCESYTALSLPDNSFDVAFAIESMSSSQQTEAFLREMYRVLKPGGRLIVLDFFKAKDVKIESVPDLRIFLNCWAINDVESFDGFGQLSVDHDFEIKRAENLNKEIRKSAKRMYCGGLAGFVGTKLYNAFKSATPWSKTHYKSGIHQWKSLKKGEWIYGAFLLRKPE